MPSPTKFGWPSFIVCVVALCVVAASAPKAHSATKLGCHRTVSGDRQTVDCTLTAVVNYSFMTRSTRPGDSISYSHICDDAGPVKGQGGIGGPAFSVKATAKGLTYYNRLGIHTPKGHNWICKIHVSASSSPSPIRPQLGFRYVTAHTAPEGVDV